ncbi:GNAT family N-acetyltransferase [soil metagenome]|jgi:GNAT superfamily N-acetyltransferase
MRRCHDPILRSFSEDDYPALAELLTLVYPDNPVSAEDLSYEDESRGKVCRFARWLAVLDGDGGGDGGGRVIGEAAYGQDADMYHPRKFWLKINVHPDFEGGEIEGLLFDKLMTALAPYQPLSLLTNIREDYALERAFYSARGFEQVMKHIEQRLVVASFNSAGYQDALERVTRGGIVIKSYAELESDPERDRKLWRLRNELDQQVPFAEPVTPVSFEWFEENILNHPNILLGGLLVAVRKNDYVGMTALLAGARDRQLNTDLTGVRGDARRQGVALALKLRAIEYAKIHNYTAIHTWVAESNRSMLVINKKLGFGVRPAWLEYVKRL